MWKMVRIPAGNTTNVHYNFVVAKPLVFLKEENTKFQYATTHQATPGNKQQTPCKELRSEEKFIDKLVIFTYTSAFTTTKL